jgi:protein-tyrosine-phosphatase/predicted ATP-grasp superfamily ATP-dependent carboligase
MDQERKIKPVLVLAGTPRVVVGIASCLYRHGIAVDVAQFPDAREIPTHKVRSVRRISAAADSAEAGEQILALLEQFEYDMVIPTTDDSLVTLAPVYGRVAAVAYPGSPAPQTVAKVLDKRLTMTIARECGISVPREYVFADLTQLEAAKSDIGFPVITKPASKIEDRDFAVRRFDAFDALRTCFLNEPDFGQKYLLQEFCPGVGVGVECLIWDSEVHAQFQHRRIKELPYTGGVSVLAEAIEVDPPLLELCIRLLRRIEWRGVAMVEFRADLNTGRAVLMEVNGRYWGSLPLSLNSGLEFPYYEWQLAHGELPKPSSYRVGLRTLWRTGDLMRVNSVLQGYRGGRERTGFVLKECIRTALDIFSFAPDAIWRWDDPRPALAEFNHHILWQVIGKMARLFPRRLRNIVWVYLNYGAVIGSRYALLKIKALLGFHGRGKRSLSGCKSFLFLCGGNIMRSPTAAAVFRKLVQNYPKFSIASAGIYAAPGRAAEPFAIAAARELGVDLSHHRSQKLTAEMVSEADAIFVMDFLNEASLLTLFPAAAPKMHRLVQWSDPAAQKLAEIKDPYGLGLDKTRHWLIIVQACITSLCAQLEKTPSRLPSEAPAEKL